ncbi:hypothetical protein FPQ18DRAFT_391022 [Pyronema domesticum]|uniref:Uncharacterized protein n=1 Tax=Pyronema omphalodes (strain CBS 100304) TaxID=1076935 RepID=U4LB67_PYROM|nr:hypothetical protein FPQ18DRAFT_391022 [Pyronema domesticum]CCX16437.1 Protein of unknown function [Pyronema omphalodes CBS 100304]
MQFFTTILSLGFAALIIAAPISDLSARQTNDFGDDGKPSMSGAGGDIIPYSNAGGGP